MNARSKKSSKRWSKFRHIPFEVTAISMLLVAAFIQRFAYHYEYKNVSVFARSPVSDAAAYHKLARSLAEKDSWADPESVHHTIGYPLAISMVYKSWGPNPNAVSIFQAALGVLNILLIVAIGKLLWGTATGVLAALLALLYGPLLFYETKLMPTVLGITFNLSFLFCFIKWKRSGYISVRKASFTGFSAGAALILRPDAALLILGASALTAYDLIKERTLPHTKKHPIRGKSLAAAAIFLLIFPAIGSLRVFSSTGRFTPLPATGGITLYSGNNPSARGTYTPYKELTGDKRHQAIEGRTIASRISGKAPQTLEAYDTSSILTRSVFKWWLRNPLKTIKLVGLKAYRFFLSSEPRSSYSFEWEKKEIRSLSTAPFTFPMILIMALLGILTTRKARKKPTSDTESSNTASSENESSYTASSENESSYTASSDTALLEIYIFVHLFTAMVFFVSTRYRTPVVPVLCLFAATSIRRLIVELPRIKGKHLIAASAIMCAAFLLHLNPLDDVKDDEFINTFNEGIALQNSNLHQQALQRFRKARRIKPSSHHAWLQEGNSLAYLGRYHKAEKTYLKATAIQPDFHQPYVNLGVIHARLGNNRKALSYLEKAASLAPDNPGVRLALAQVLLKANDIPRARREFQKTKSLAKELDPDTAATAEKYLRSLRSRKKHKSPDENP